MIVYATNTAEDDISFQVHGSTGHDGYGSTTTGTSVGSVDPAPHSIKGLFKLNCNEDMFNILHLVLVNSSKSTGATQQIRSIPTYFDTDNDDSVVAGIAPGDTVYYLLVVTKAYEDGCMGTDRINALMDTMAIAIMSGTLASSSYNSLIQTSLTDSGQHPWSLFISDSDLSNGVIPDGGNDVYDNGNRLTTSICMTARPTPIATPRPSGAPTPLPSHAPTPSGMLAFRR